MFEDKIKQQIDRKLVESEVGDEATFFEFDNDYIGNLLTSIEQTINDTDKTCPMLTMDAIEEYSPLSAFFTKKSILDYITLEFFDHYFEAEVLRSVEKTTRASAFWDYIDGSHMKKLYIFFNLNPIRPMQFSKEVQAGQARKTLTLKCWVHKKEFNIRLNMTYGAVAF